MRASGVFHVLCGSLDRFAAAPRSLAFTLLVEVLTRGHLAWTCDTSWSITRRTEDEDLIPRIRVDEYRRHDTDTRPLAELEAHRSCRSPSFTSGVRASPDLAGSLLFSHPFTSIVPLRIPDRAHPSAHL